MMVSCKRIIVVFFEKQLTIATIDRLQFTVTSRKEMPNARFVKQIAKAADDLHALHQEAITTTKPRL
jgi:hypothetical protein